LDKNSLGKNLRVSNADELEEQTAGFRETRSTCGPASAIPSATATTDPDKLTRHERLIRTWVEVERIDRPGTKEERSKNWTRYKSSFGRLQTNVRRPRRPDGDAARLSSKTILHEEGSRLAVAGFAPKNTMVLHVAMHPGPNCCRLIDNCTKAVKGPVGTVPYALAEAEGPVLGLRTGRASSCYSALPSTLAITAGETISGTRQSELRLRPRAP
jgi:hypothetical protein